jgi:hypothetical protein
VHLERGLIRRIRPAEFGYKKKYNVNGNALTANGKMSNILLDEDLIIIKKIAIPITPTSTK